MCRWALPPEGGPRSGWGRRVAERDLSSLGSGRHVVRFDPPGGLAAGVYLFRLTQEGRVATGRVTLMR